MVLTAASRAGALGRRAIMHNYLAARTKNRKRSGGLALPANRAPSLMAAFTAERVDGDSLDDLPPRWNGASGHRIVNSA